MRLTATLVVMVACVATRARAQSATVRSVTLPAPNASLAAEFTSVTSVRELPDARLLIVDGGEKAVMVADWTTKGVTRVGRNGSGPGEYLQPSTLFALGGDSTLLPDTRNGRWLVLRGPSIVATIGPDAPAIRNNARQPVGADDHGHVLVTRSIVTGERPAPTAMPRRDSLVLTRVDRATGRADTVARVRARPAQITIQGPADKPTAVSVLMNPLATGELSALFPDGWIAIARLDPYRVDWIAPDGKRITGSPLPFERVRLDDRERRAFVERQAERTGRPVRDPSSFAEWPDAIPPFLPEPLLSAPDGRLWIRRAPTAANANPPYDVVDRRGELVARVAAGKDVQVVGFGRDAVYTVATDENGVQQVQRRAFPKF
jgi:hypothetical protein